MDWLCDCVEGSIPTFDQLLPMSPGHGPAPGACIGTEFLRKRRDPPVKILLVSDEECLYLWDYYRPGRLDGIDLILSCGDLNAEYLSFPGDHGAGSRSLRPW